MVKSKSAYSEPTKLGKSDHHIIVVWVDNETGVLARVIGLFSGGGYNIESLAVAEVDKLKHLSRITIVSIGTPEVVEQIKLQLRKLLWLQESPPFLLTKHLLAGSLIGMEFQKAFRLMMKKVLIWAW